MKMSISVEEVRQLIADHFTRNTKFQFGPEHVNFKIEPHRKSHRLVGCEVEVDAITEEDEV